MRRMRMLAAIVLWSCATPQEDPPEIRSAIEAIRAGRTPENLKDLKDRRVLAAIATRVRDRKPCPESVLFHLCANAAREHSEALVDLLDHSSVKVAYAAIFAVAPLVEERLLPSVAKKLDTGRDAQIRALTLLAESRYAPAGALLEKRLSLLDAADRERSKAMLRALAACRVRAAHDAVLAYYEKTEDDGALRALGRIWEMKLDAAPLERDQEIRRLSSLVLARRLAMGAATSDVSCEAMLRLMTREEFEKFLTDFAREKFFARRVVAASAMAPGFERAKGARVLEALLDNPDPGLVGQILVGSPFDLPRKRLASLLANSQDVKIDVAPEHSRVCDLAVWRLTLQLDKREDEIPPEIEKRDALVKSWKERLER